MYYRLLTDLIQNEEEGSEEEQSDEYVPTDEESVELEEEDSDEDYSSVSEASESGMLCCRHDVFNSASLFIMCKLSL